MRHKYLNVASKKPLDTDIEPAELIPNLADGTLWSKTPSGTVIPIGGSGGGSGGGTPGPVADPQVYSGTSAPSNFDGNDNDIYIQRGRASEPQLTSASAVMPFNSDFGMHTYINPNSTIAPGASVGSLTGDDMRVSGLYTHYAAATNDDYLFIVEPAPGEDVSSPTYTCTLGGVEFILGDFVETEPGRGYYGFSEGTGDTFTAAQKAAVEQVVNTDNTVFAREGLVSFPQSSWVKLLGAWTLLVPIKIQSEVPTDVSTSNDPNGTVYYIV